MVEMLTQNPPWPKLTAMQWMFKLSQQQKPEYSLPPSISKTAQNFLNDMFNYDDRIRPTSEQLLGHPWFKTQEIDSLSGRITIKILNIILCRLRLGYNHGISYKIFIFNFDRDERFFICFSLELQAMF